MHYLSTETWVASAQYLQFSFLRVSATASHTERRIHTSVLFTHSYRKVRPEERPTDRQTDRQTRSGSVHKLKQRSHGCVGGWLFSDQCLLLLSCHLDRVPKFTSTWIQCAFSFSFLFSDWHRWLKRYRPKHRVKMSILYISKSNSLHFQVCSFVCLMEQRGTRGGPGAREHFHRFVILVLIGEDRAKQRKGMGWMMSLGI